MSFAMANWFVTEPGKKLGTLITRSGSMNFPLNPRTRPYKRPVAVLVDELSMSTSEIFAGGLQDLKLARIFGTKTPGAALPSVVEMLPNGDRFQFADRQLHLRRRQAARRDWRLARRSHIRSRARHSSKAVIRPSRPRSTG